VRLGEAENGRGGDGRINRIAALAQHINGGKGGQRRRGGGHAVGAEGQRTSRLIEISHNYILFHWRQKLPQNCRKQHRIVVIYIARKPASCSCRSLALLPTDGLFERNVLFPGMNEIFS
jgi:hypothetical protein